MKQREKIMAEFYMSYDEFYQFVDSNIDEQYSNAKDFEAEILTALTSYIDEGTNLKNIPDMVSLWELEDKPSSELLFGKRYIKLSETTLVMLSAFLTSGVADAFIQSISQNPSQFGLSVAMCTSVVVALNSLFKAVSKLDVWDFCVYMQATTHFNTHKSFTKTDLDSWFTACQNGCNMHDSRWDCKHRRQDDSCCILEDDRLQTAINSLVSKGILISEYNEGAETWKFKF